MAEITAKSAESTSAPAAAAAERFAENNQTQPGHFSARVTSQCIAHIGLKTPKILPKLLWKQAVQAVRKEQNTLCKYIAQEQCGAPLVEYHAAHQPEWGTAQIVGGTMSPAEAAQAVLPSNNNTLKQ